MKIALVLTAAARVVNRHDFDQGGFASRSKSGRKCNVGAFSVALLLALGAQTSQALAQDQQQPPPVIPGLPPIQIPGLTPPQPPPQQQQPQQPYYPPQQQQPQQPYYPPQQPQQPQQPYYPPQQQQPYYPPPQGQQPPQWQPYQPPTVQPQQPQPGWNQPQQPGWNQPPNMRRSSPNDPRSPSEIPFFYAAGIGYGVGTGIGLDLLFKVKGGATLILPVILGGAGAVGAFLADDLTTLHRGVPASMALGTGLGFGFGMNMMQYLLVSPEKEWPQGTRAVTTWLFTTGGAVGGYFFGDWIRPRPATISFIGSGTGWGTATGLMLGAGVSTGNLDNSKDTMAWGGLIGYTVGTVGVAALDLAWTPSMQTQKWMWAGYGIGAAGLGLLSLPLLYGADQDARGAFAVAAVGGIAGASIFAVFTNDLVDDDDAPRTADGKPAKWKPPFELGFAPSQGGGGTVTAFGQW
jgi:hypothetical protein